MDTSSISHTTHTVCHISKHELRTANRTGTRRGSFLVRCIVDQIALILNLWAWEAQAHFPVQMYSLDSSGNRNMYLSPTSVLSLFLVRPDTHTQRKYSKPRMHRKDKNKTQKRFPKNIQIMCRLSLMAFFSPLIVNTDVAEGYKYFLLISWWALPAVSALGFGPEGKTRINTSDSFVLSVLRDIVDFDNFWETQLWEETQPVSPGRSQAQNQTWSLHSNRCA